MIEKKEQPVIHVISVEDKPAPKKEDNPVTAPKPIPCPTQHKKMIELPVEECEESEEEESEETSETSETHSLTSIISDCEDIAVDVLKQLIKGQQKGMDEHINKLIEDAINKYKEEQKPKDTEQANIQHSAEAPAENKPADK